MRRKGNAWVALVALVMLFFVTATWILLSNVFTPHLFPLVGDMLSGYPEASNTLDILKMSWNNWPLIIVVGIVIYAIVGGQKKEQRFTRV